MRLVVLSHKVCWPSATRAGGYATDGGFSFQMSAIAELFDETVLVLPCSRNPGGPGHIPLNAPSSRVVPLPLPFGKGFWRKLLFPAWIVFCAPTIIRELRAADAVHAPIPGDVGTVGMVLAWLFHKPLLVRHCGNWLKPVTVAEKFWRWFMERFAGGRNVMLATGGAVEPPSRRNPNVSWIFSSSLTRDELENYARERECPAGAELRLVNVARQETAKGAGLIIRSLPLLARRFPQASLEIIGEGSAIPEFKRLAREIGVADRVRFSGKLNHEQVMQRLQDAALFVFPTMASDGFPKAVLEGLASGLPVVATPVSVLPRLLANGCGVLLEEASAEAVARGIERAVSSPVEYARMSRNAIQTARQYSLEGWRDAIGESLAAAWGPLKKTDAKTVEILAAR